MRYACHKGQADIMTTLSKRQAPRLDATSPAWIGLLAIGLTLLFLSLVSRNPNLTLKTLSPFFSGPGNTAFLILGYSALLIDSLRKRDPIHLRAILLTFLWVTLMVHAQKAFFGAWLPRPSGHWGGFPSGHAAAAHALAFLIALSFPRWSMAGYGMAIAIPMSAHGSYQVVAGAATGSLIALLITDRGVKRVSHHQIASVWQNPILMVIPLFTIFYRQHEYENDTVILLCAGLMLLSGIALHSWQTGQRPWRTATSQRRQHALASLSSTLIYAGATFAQSGSGWRFSSF